MPDAPVDLAQLPLAVDIVAVLRAIAIARGLRHRSSRAPAARPSIAAPALRAAAGTRRARSVPSLSRIEVRLALRHTTVVIEKPANTLTSVNAAARVLHRWYALNQFIREALVIPLKVVMFDELRDRPAKMTGAQWNHPVETLVLDGTHEPFRVGICVGRVKWRLDHADAGFVELYPHGPAPFRISIA